jgi:gliding motility-associated-like protein
MRFFVGFLFLLFLGLSSAEAQRIYGGQIDRRIMDASNPKPYSYGVGCTFFTDKAGYDALPSKLRFGVYRKKDNQLMQEYFADKSTDVSGSNSATSCDKSSKTEYLFVRYNYNLTLKPQDFSDTDGYYIVNAPVGPRNPTDNIVSSDIVLYHWFSPAYLWEYFEPAEAGKTTPQWVPDSYNYFCANAETNFSLQVASVPLKTGLTRNNFNLVISNTAPLTGSTGSVPYRKIDWKSGFSESQMLPGTNFNLPPLPPNIFGGQGITNIVISAKPTRKGVFSVGFLLQHSRSGVKLSETYREYQIEVEDCLTPPPANIRISEVNRPNVPASAVVCEGKSVQLNAGANEPNVTYEWKKDGVVISGQKDSVLVVNQQGSYVVTLKKKGSCSAIESIPKAITIVANPTVTTTTATTDNFICPNKSLAVSALPSDKNVKYQWLRDSIPLPNANATSYNITQTGSYAVVVTDANGCIGQSKPFEIKVFTAANISLQAIPNKCSDDTASVLLIGTPQGGAFSGKGVSNGKFVPAVAGAGLHEIIYTLKDDNSCINGTAKQSAEVWAIPTVDLGPDQDISQNTSVQLNTRGNLGAKYTYQWTPPTDLDNPTSATPFASPDKTTTYSLKITDTNGCFNRDSITIGLIRGVHIPDVFTPNGDGLNDTWEIRGLEEFASSQVVVYDRWGHAIFETDQTKKAKFDGTYNGTALPTGSYAYVIQTFPNGHSYRGKLLIMR